MDREQLKELIEETINELSELIKPSQHAINLVAGTIAQESDNAHYIRQIKGPAMGIAQMEPGTFDDICTNYLQYRLALESHIKQMCNCNVLTPYSLSYNSKLAIVFCRLHYLRVPAPLPETIEGYAVYWKKYYNTNLGKGTVGQFIKNYQKYVL